MRKQLVAVILCVLVISQVSHAGLGSKKTKYIGGTISALNEGVEGESSAKDEKEFVFAYKEGRFTIPYDKITELEYGQKAGRRVAVAILVTPLALFSKKRRHYLTITYLDGNNKEQVGVFEFGKDVVRVNLASLQARTGKDIQYQDEEARKSAKGN
jgi:hypothetical protein